MSSKPYVVLLGDVGSGKSTIVEKLTGQKGRSSAASQSETLNADVFETHDGSLIIADTPGSNAMADQFTHNLHIANAMNFLPVTCILIVVKAEERMDNVIKCVCNYAQGFIPEDIPTDLIAVCVTHMDTVSWKESDMLEHFNHELNIETAIFCSKETRGNDLKDSMLNECSRRQQFTLNVDGEMFLKLFNLEIADMKMHVEVRREVRTIEKMNEDFEKQRGHHSKRMMDLVFEFFAFINSKFADAQNKISEANQPRPMDILARASHLGHSGKMANQVHQILINLNSEVAQYRSEYRTDRRVCYYCTTPCQNKRGDDYIKCPNREGSYPSPAIKDGKEIHEFAHFTFVWDSTCERLEVKKSDQSSKLICGKKLRWSCMAPFVGLVGTDRTSHHTSTETSRLPNYYPRNTEKLESNLQSFYFDADGFLRDRCVEFEDNTGEIVHGTYYHTCGGCGRKDKVRRSQLTCKIDYHTSRQGHAKNDSMLGEVRSTGGASSSPSACLDQQYGVPSSNQRTTLPLQSEPRLVDTVNNSSTHQSPYSSGSCLNSSNPELNQW